MISALRGGAAVAAACWLDGRSLGYSRVLCARAAVVLGVAAVFPFGGRALAGGPPLGLLGRVAGPASGALFVA